MAASEWRPEGGEAERLHGGEVREWSLHPDTLPGGAEQVAVEDHRAMAAVFCSLGHYPLLLLPVSLSRGHLLFAEGPTPRLQRRCL